jgi:hypothetical protein
MLIQIKKKLFHLLLKNINQDNLLLLFWEIPMEVIASFQNLWAKDSIMTNSGPMAKSSSLAGVQESFHSATSSTSSSKESSSWRKSTSQPLWQKEIP